MRLPTKKLVRIQKINTNSKSDWNGTYLDCSPGYWFAYHSRSWSLLFWVELLLSFADHVVSALGPEEVRLTTFQVSLLESWSASLTIGGGNTSASPGVLCISGLSTRLCRLWSVLFAASVCTSAFSFFVFCDEFGKREIFGITIYFHYDRFFFDILKLIYIFESAKSILT